MLGLWVTFSFIRVSVGQDRHVSQRMQGLAVPICC